MLTGKEDLLQALVEAYIMEKGTREFYLQAADKSSSAGARKSFHELSLWEDRHMAYIQSLYQSILDDRELEEFSSFSAKVLAPVTESGIPVKELARKIETYTIKDERDALGLAVTIEAKSYNLYKDLAARAVDSEAKVIFEEMMAQEAKHMNYLNSLKQALPRSS